MMNCDDFEVVLQEYLDGGLEPDVLASVDEHLRQCGDCRQAVAREKALARSLRHSFTHATAGLSLRTDLKRNVLRALESSPSRRRLWWPGWRKFFSCVRPVPTAASFLCIILLLLGVQFYPRLLKRAPAGTIPQDSRPELVVHVPIPMQTYVFKHHDSMVVDETTAGVGLGYANFPNAEKSLLGHATKPL